jgi:hypothetical protein
MGAISESILLYERAHRDGWWHRLRARLRGRPTRLLDLATIVAGGTISARHALGQQTVPIAMIRGTEGRRDAFDDAFHPLNTRSRQRWHSIARAWLQGVSLPPVDLIRVGDIYVVRDGHHRISVLRALGIDEIDAVVTAWDITPAPQAKPTPAGVSRRASPQHPRL